jgi:hypothetical protein
MLNINAFDDAAKTVFAEVITRRKVTFQEGAATPIVYDVVRYSQEKHGGRNGRTAEGDTVTLVRRPEAERYNPHDLDGDQLAQLWQGWYRYAIWHGVDEEAAEEAASIAMIHFMDVLPKKGQVERGDHYHAYYSTRAMIRFSNWKGYTNNRRDSKREISEERIRWEENAKQVRRNPHPHSLATMQEASDKATAAILDQCTPAGVKRADRPNGLTRSQSQHLRQINAHRPAEAQLTMSDLEEVYQATRQETVENWAEFNGLDLEPQKGLVVEAVDRPQPKTLAAMVAGLTDEHGQPASEKEKAEFYQANLLHRKAKPTSMVEDYNRPYRVSH